MPNWETQVNDMTNNKKRSKTTPDAPQFGYITKPDPRNVRRTFALSQSLIDALQKIAKEKDTNINDIVNTVLMEYAKNYLKED